MYVSAVALRRRVIKNKKREPQTRYVTDAGHLRVELGRSSVSRAAEMRTWRYLACSRRLTDGGANLLLFGRILAGRTCTLPSCFEAQMVVVVCL